MPISPGTSAPIFAQQAETNILRRAFRALFGWMTPDYWLGSPGVVNPPCPLTDYLNTDITAALSLPAVVRAIACYSDSVASLPRRVVRRSPRAGMEVDDSSDAAHLLSSVPYFDLEALAASSIAYGNGYALIERNDRGGAADIAWVPAVRVQPGLDERRRLFYRIARDDSLGEPERVLPAADIVHVKFRATGAQSRYVGCSPLTLCAPAVAMALRAVALQAEIHRNVSLPSTVITIPSNTGDRAADRLRTEIKQEFGAPNRGRTMVLSGGITVDAFKVGSAVDAQLKDQFDFSIAEIARCLGVPLSLLAQPGGVTHGAAIEESRSFASMSLAPFCARVADELSQKLLTPAQLAGGWSVEFDLSAMLISPAEVADRYSKLVNGGLMSTNEAREFLGLPDVEAGDLLRVPVNVAPLENWVNGNTPAQQLAHDQVPANPQEAGYKPPLRAV